MQIKLWDLFSCWKQHVDTATDTNKTFKKTERLNKSKASSPTGVGKLALVQLVLAVGSKDGLPHLRHLQIASPPWQAQTGLQQGEQMQEAPPTCCIWPGHRLILWQVKDKLWVFVKHSVQSILIDIDCCTGHDLNSNKALNKTCLLTYRKCNKVFELEKAANTIHMFCCCCWKSCSHSSYNYISHETTHLLIQKCMFC